MEIVHFSASFVTECCDVSYVAGKGDELTVNKESVVVEEIKEVELRSRLFARSRTEQTSGEV